MEEKSKRKRTSRTPKGEEKRSRARVRSPDAPWKPRFLKVLRDTNSVSHACAAVRISRDTAYQHRKDDAAFASAWDQAKHGAVEDLEASLFQRAKNGWKNAVYYKGRQVGLRLEHSASLSIFMLSKLAPERFDTGKFDPTQRFEDSDQDIDVLFYPDAEAVREAAAQEDAQQ